MVLTRFKWTATGQSILVNPKRNAISVTVDGIPVYSFDLEGRLLYLYDGERTLLRGLDNQVLEKRIEQTPSGRIKRRRKLTPPEARAVHDDVQRLAGGLHGAVSAGSVTFEGNPPASARARTEEALALISAWGGAELEEDGRRFVQIYGRVSILPPDQYYALVLQATLGCPYNRCTFCTFYRGREFRIRTAQEFRAHLQEVREFFGRGLALRRSIFLGDANALVAPQGRLVSFFQEARAAFPELPSVYSFLDVFSQHKPPAELAELRELGLRRVYLGVETGHDPLLKFLRKPGSADRARRTVEAVKAGGVSVAVIIMLGVGGDRYSPAHVEDTARLLNALHLDGEDIVYFSPLVIRPESDYAGRAAAADIRELTEEEMQVQEERIKAHLAPGCPKTFRYDVRDFVY